MIANAPGKSYEPADVSAKGLVMFFFVFVGTAVVIHIGVTAILMTLSAGRPTMGATADPREETMIQGWVHPAQELRVVQGAARERLSSYGWVDRAHGVVHIPIERAMALIAREAGDPARGGSGKSGSAQGAQP